MPIAFTCPSCRRPLNVPDAMAGRSGKCPQCKSSIMVPQRSMAMAGAISNRPMAASPMSGRYVQTGAAPRVTGRSPWMKLSALVGLGSAATAAALVGMLFLGGSGPIDPMAYLPDNCQAVVIVRMEELINSGAFKELKTLTNDLPPPASRELTKLNETPEEVGLAFEDMVVITAGYNVASGLDTMSEPDNTSLVQTKNKVTADDLKGKMKKYTFTESKVGRFSVYETPAVPGKRKDMAFTVLNDKNVLYGTPSVVKKVLERNKKPELGETMQAALKDLDQTKTVGFAMTLKDLTGHAMVKKGSAAVPPNLQGFIGDLEYLVLHIGVATDIEISSVVKLKSDKSADDLRKLAEGGVTLVKTQFADKLPPEATEIIDGIKMASAGGKFTVNLPLKTASLVALAKKGPALLGPLMKGGGPPPPPM